MNPTRRAIASTAAAAILLIIATFMLAAGTVRPGQAIVYHTSTTPSTTPVTLPPPPPPLLARGRPVTASPHILSWTLRAVTTGAVIAAHSCIGCTNPAASTMKVWLAGDALRRDGPSALTDADAAIIDSDNAAATRLFRAGGSRTGLWRMTYTCHLSRTLPQDAWGETRIASGDLAMLGVCAARGDIAGPWTPHLLDRMRHVRGAGRFGPVDALPTADVALKNGWLIVAGEWNVNCLAIINGSWSLGVITRYPAELGLAHGAQLCADVTHALATPAHIE